MLGQVINWIINPASVTAAANAVTPIVNATITPVVNATLIPAVNATVFAVESNLPGALASVGTAIVSGLALAGAYVWKKLSPANVATAPATPAIPAADKLGSEKKKEEPTKVEKKEEKKEAATSPAPAIPAATAAATTTPAVTPAFAASKERTATPALSTTPTKLKKELVEAGLLVAGLKK